jgi:hypothetical protein
VREVVEVLPQASVTVHVLVCDREHPLLLTAPSVPVMVDAVVGPQLSV